MGKQRPKRHVALLSQETKGKAFAPGSRLALAALQPSEPPTVAAATVAAATVAAATVAAATEGATGAAGSVTMEHPHDSRHASVMLFGTLEHACQHCTRANRKACTAGQCNEGGGSTFC